jgi:hypothetical protein
MIKKSLLVLAVSLALTASLFAAPAKSSKAQTVGEFAVKVNAALGRVSADQKTAADSLKALGVDLGKDLSAALTEERAVGILRDLGVRVIPGNPDSEVSGAKADQLIASLALNATVSSPVPASELPQQCLNEFNRGKCQNCCKATFGCIDPNAPCEFSSRCSKFCKAILHPGISPTEPT